MITSTVGTGFLYRETGFPQKGQETQLNVLFKRRLQDKG